MRVGVCVNDDNFNLTGKEKLELVIEAGIGAIPIVGGPLQTLYFGSQNEKRFKRVEQFYSDLNNDLEKMKQQIPPMDTLVNKDEFLGLIEDINSEVEKAKSQPKIDYFKSFYKNTLLTSNSSSFDTHSFFLEALINLTNLELRLLKYFFDEGPAEFKGDISVPGVSEDLVIGSLNRLADFGFLTTHLNSIVLGGPSSRANNGYKINQLGIQFSLFIVNS